METELAEAEWVWADLIIWTLLKRRGWPLCHGQYYQRQIAQAYDKKVKPRFFQEADLVLKKILHFKEDPCGKFQPNYGGPYVVKKVF